MARLRLGELLVEARVIAQEQLTTALEAQRESGRKLGQVLIDLKLVNETQLTQVLSQQLSVPWVSLYHIDFSRELLNLVPRALAERYTLVPVFIRNVRKQGNTLYVAMDDPTNEAALEEVSEAAGMPARPMIASPSDIRGAIRAYYSQSEAALVAAPPAVADAKYLPAAGGPGSGSVSAAVASGPAPDGTSVETAAPAPATSGDSPDDEPVVEAHEVELKRQSASTPRMVALTLLDGTTIRVPARGRSDDPDDAPPPASQLTTRDLVAALRAVSQGKDASEVLGGKHTLEAIAAALLSVLMKKGLVADWEFVEELNKL